MNTIGKLLTGTMLILVTLSLTSCELLFGEEDNAIPSTSLKKLTKVSCVNHGSHPDENNEESVGITYDSQGRVSIVSFIDSSGDPTICTSTYSENIVQITFKDEKLVYTIENGKVIKLVRTYGDAGVTHTTTTTYVYSGDKLIEMNEEHSSDSNTGFKYTWSDNKIVKAVEYGVKGGGFEVEYNPTYSSIAANSVAVALFLFGSDDFGCYFDIDELRRTGPIFDKFGKMPPYLFEKVIKGSQTSTMSYEMDKNGYIVKATIKREDTSTNSTTTTDYVLTWQ